jgi:hypothetical protein
MKSKDRIKEEIGLYKLLMTIFSAIASSTLGWLFSNIGDMSIFYLLIGIITAIFSLISIFILFFKINTKIEDLDYV